MVFFFYLNCLFINDLGQLTVLSVQRLKTYFFLPSFISVEAEWGLLIHS